MKIDGIVFDLDGTLWDSTQVVSDSWGKTLRERFGADRWPDRNAVRSIMGMTADGIAAKLFSEYEERAVEICTQCIHGENDYIAEHSGDIYPGVEDMLRRLAGQYPLFIVSNCLDGYIQCFLKVSGFGKYFKDFECEGHTGLSKAGNIQLICRRNLVKAPVYVGDTHMDEKSAADAGCPFIHVSYGFGSAVSPAAAADSPSELAALITDMGRI